MFRFKFKKIKKTTAVKLMVFGLLILVALPFIVSAQTGSTNYVPLAPIGNYVTSNGTDLSTYLESMFKLGIGVAIGLAVIMIIIGGVQLVSTDSITGQLQGKDRITSALWGLVLALAAWVILNTINPQLLCTQLNINSSGTTQTSSCSK